MCSREQDMVTWLHSGGVTGFPPFSAVDGHLKLCNRKSNVSL
jgi:hypothetical protein